MLTPLSYPRKCAQDPWILRLSHAASLPQGGRRSAITVPCRDAENGKCRAERQWRGVDWQPLFEVTRRVK